MADNTIKARLNEKEQQQFEELKVFLGFKDQFGEDSNAIKSAINIAISVAHLFYGEKLPQLFSGVKDFKEKKS